MDKLLVIQVAALGHDLLHKAGILGSHGLEFRPAESVFPALTCPVQASFRTALEPERHGMIANGVYDRRLNRPMFWNNIPLISGERIWENSTPVAKGSA